ncbi:hypothetical protein MKW98_024144 [Papaver atlanticum]|uniref:Uncharacterized protein n=1 Tax=Papaver atlanticum TaxID=357466 RepID=A0AAD4SXV1_9MAGN|nr:hypothetical protein MKW98_024144 [Papaver atlanticum]
MESAISSSLTTGPAELSGDSLTGSLHFIPSMETIYPGYEIIGGFSVPSRHALLYSEIWVKFGHVATTEVLKHRSLLVTFVDELLSTVEEMRSKSFNEITKESISRWEKMISYCEGVRFNIR